MLRQTLTSGPTNIGCTRSWKWVFWLALAFHRQSSMWGSTIPLVRRHHDSCPRVRPQRQKQASSARKTESNWNRTQSTTVDRAGVVRLCPNTITSAQNTEGPRLTGRHRGGTRQPHLTPRRNYSHRTIVESRSGNQQNIGLIWPMHYKALTKHLLLTSHNIIVTIHTNADL